MFFFRGKQERKEKEREGKYFEKENIWSMEEEKKNGEGKGGIIWRRKVNGYTDRPTNRPTERIQCNLPFSNVRK